MADKPPTTEPKTTEALCTWIHGLTLADVPPEVVTRAKHVILDGVACGLVGAHLPWSETAVNAVLDMEPPLPDGAGLFGWEKVGGRLGKRMATPDQRPLSNRLENHPPVRRPAQQRLHPGL